MNFWLIVISFISFSFSLYGMEQVRTDTTKLIELVKQDAVDEDEILAELKTIKDVDERDEKGRTALHWACWLGRKAVVELLLVRGADIQAKDDFLSYPTASSSWWGPCGRGRNLTK